MIIVVVGLLPLLFAAWWVWRGRNRPQYPSRPTLTNGQPWSARQNDRSLNRRPDF